MTLWPRLPIDPEETHLSYAERLGLLHTGRGMERLLVDLGIHREHFVSGRAEAVRRLAEATGHAFEALQNITVRVFQRCASFRGEEISKTFLSPRPVRYCPACLAEDGPDADRRHRLIWGFRHVSRCDRHSLWLADAPVKKTTSLRMALEGAGLAAAADAPGETPEYITWLRQRVHGVPVADDSWLHDQTLEQVLAASENIGGVLERGHDVALTKLTPAQTEEVTDIGFSIYREGPEAVVEALNAIRRASTATAVQAGPLAYYGRLHEWLDNRGKAIEPGPIRDILRDHIVKHSAVEPRTIILGVEITERRFHTLQSLSAEVGIPRQRLGRLLKKLGEIPENATETESANIPFEVDTIEPLIRSFQTAVTLQDVPEYLAASKGQVEALYREGILHPLVPRTAPGSVRQVVFSRDHLDDILQKMQHLPLLQTADTAAGVHPISYACQHGAGPFAEVFRAVLRGQVRCFRDPEQAGVRALYVDLKSIVRKGSPA